ncbi:MAG: site-2 protease family protein [Erysipelotrichia bacterium]|nr:site-2 protease family protein [Erysipelotrichia bacterium]
MNLSSILSDLIYTIPAVLIAIVLHEWAHGFISYKLGDPSPKADGRLSLNPLKHLDPVGTLCLLFFHFGWAKPVPINTYNFKNIKRDTFFVSLSGIFTNLVFAFVFYPIFILFSNISDLSIVWLIFTYLCLYIYQANLVFAVFNLLPIYPLDGFNALATQLKYNNPYVNFMRRYGGFTLIFVILIFSQTNFFSTLISWVGYPIIWFWGLIF